MNSRIIAITGVDGSGKTTLVKWLKEELERRGHAPGFVWSRFNNYVSLPFLALTRLTGHNYYQEHDGVRMGYHDFRKFPFTIKAIFVLAQIIDVNIATTFLSSSPASFYWLGKFCFRLRVIVGGAFIPRIFNTRPKSQIG